MRKKIRNIIKSTPAIYQLYAAIGSALLWLFGLFLRLNKKQILFVVYAGKRYDDSPKRVYELMKKDDRYKDFHFYWAFEKPEEIKEVPDTEKIKIDTIKYFKIALTSQYWITNSSATRGLYFKKKSTINIFFPHGMTGIKIIGADIKGENKSFHGRKQEHFDIIVLEGTQEEKIIRHAWKYQEGLCWNIGFPRNDDLLTRTSNEIVELKHKLGIEYSGLKRPGYRGSGTIVPQQ